MSQYSEIDTGKISLVDSGNQSNLETSDIESALSKIIEHSLNDL